MMHGLTDLKNCSAARKFCETNKVEQNRTEQNTSPVEMSAATLLAFSLLCDIEPSAELPNGQGAVVKWRWRNAASLRYCPHVTVCLYVAKSDVC